MILLQTILVYLCLTLMMVITSYLAAKSHKKWMLMIPVLLFSIVFGMRYGVGIDFYAYLEMFEYGNTPYINVISESFEPAFVFLIHFCHYFNLGSFGYFFILAFIQIFFLYVSFRKHKYVLSFLPIVLIFTGIAMTGFMNSIRQTIAFCIFVFSIHYISNKKLIYYCVLILLASLFHRSALILFPLYFIWCNKDQWFRNVNRQVVLVLVSFVAANMVSLQQIVEYFDLLIDWLGYSRYLDNHGDKMYNNSTLSLGYILILFLYLLIVVNSKRMKLMFADKTFNIMYDLFLIGVLCEFFFHSSQMMMRITYYFNGFKLVLMSYALFYFYKQRFCNTICLARFVVVSLVFLLFFIRIILFSETNTTQYVFNFQKEWHTVKKAQHSNMILTL
jgi:hypothetical protein